MFPDGLITSEKYDKAVSWSSVRR